MKIKDITHIAKLIGSYLNKTLSSQERQELEIWMRKSPRHLMLFKKFTSRNFVEQKLRFDESLDVVAAMENVLRRKKRRKYLVRLGMFGSIAAVLLVMYAVAWFVPVGERLLNSDVVVEPNVTLVLSSGDSIVLNELEKETIVLSKTIDTLARAFSKTIEAKDECREIIVPMKKTFTFRLEDGTTINLNANSRLKYMTSMCKSREVFLVGEAYFKVAKNEESPFLVHTPNQTIKVLGTEFNVNTRGESKEETVLVEGSVSVSLKDGGKEYKLKPSQMASYDLQTGEVVIREVQSELYVAWQDGAFVFDNVSLEYFLVRLSEWYDFNIMYVNDTLRDKRISCYVLKEENLASLLKAIEKLVDVKLELIEGTLLIK